MACNAALISRVHEFSTCGHLLAFDVSVSVLILLIPHFIEGWGQTLCHSKVQPACQRVLRTYPQLRPAPVRDDVVDVPVVAQAQGGTAHQGAHVQGEDRDEQGFSALQVTVKQDGYENDLREGETGRVRGRRRHQAAEAQPDSLCPDAMGF